mmetsp:Transcript_10457/g.28605  ORF Transcript_10457/g.28605 Transcript_10457/m.28605 type:complete len:144 (+) Transcript_10457:53-484(+)
MQSKNIFPGVQRLEGLTASASHEKSDDDAAENVLTDNKDERWNAGRPASPNSPVYIDIDVPAGVVIDHLNLLPYQVPTTGHTHHRIFVDGELVSDQKGTTKHNEAIGPVKVDRPGRKIRVETVETPSWVSWSKIEVFGRPDIS